MYGISVSSNYGGKQYENVVIYLNYVWDLSAKLGYKLIFSDIVRLLYKNLLKTMQHDTYDKY